MLRLNANIIIDDVSHALREDIASGDVTANLLSNSLQVNARVISRVPMLLCGRPWFDETMHQVDSSIKVTWLHEEGSWLPAACQLCHITGPARAILTAERTALNFLQTLSGTASTTYHYLQQLKGYKTQLLDTRKTIPGLRLAQKYAVRCAGGVNHRMGLYDAFLIKENHINACGSITAAVNLARQTSAKLPIIVEVETIEQLQEAFLLKPDRILLDNFTHDMIRHAVALSQVHAVSLEVSGGIDHLTLAAIAATGVDFISVGALTKSVSAIDLSLRITDDA